MSMPGSCMSTGYHSCKVRPCRPRRSFRYRIARRERRIADHTRHEFKNRIGESFGFDSRGVSPNQTVEAYKHDKAMKTDQAALNKLGYKLFSRYVKENAAELYIIQTEQGTAVRITDELKADFYNHLTETVDSVVMDFNHSQYTETIVERADSPLVNNRRDARDFLILGRLSGEEVRSRNYHTSVATARDELMIATLYEAGLGYDGIAKIVRDTTGMNISQYWIDTIAKKHDVYDADRKDPFKQAIDKLDGTVPPSELKIFDRFRDRFGEGADDFLKELAYEAANGIDPSKLRSMIRAGVMDLAGSPAGDSDYTPRVEHRGGIISWAKAGRKFMESYLSSMQGAGYFFDGKHREGREAFGNAYSLAKEGFTLIELLVVVSIIGVLISILVPALKEAKEIANRAVCGVQIHNTLNGQVMYANDFNGSMPLINTDAIQLDNLQSTNFLWSAGTNSFFFNGVLVGDGKDYNKLENMFCSKANYFTIDNASSGKQNFRVPGKNCRGSYYQRGTLQGAKKKIDEPGNIAVIADYTTFNPIGDFDKPLLWSHQNGINVGCTGGNVKFVSGKWDVRSVSFGGPVDVGTWYLLDKE